MWKTLFRRFARTPAPAKPSDHTRPTATRGSSGGVPTPASEEPADSRASRSPSGHANQDPIKANQTLARTESRTPSSTVSTPGQPSRFLARQSPPHRQKRSPSRERSLWLGVDYGTSMSKLVLTDYDAIDGAHSFPVRPTHHQGGDGGCRVPSTVSVESGILRFGFAAESQGGADGVFRSLKMLCAYPDRFYGDHVPLPTELNARDLATLFVGHLVQLGQQAAIRYAADLGAEPTFGITLGVPMAELDDEELHRMFVSIAREAFHLKDRIDLLGSVTVTAAAAALAAVREALAGTEVAEPRDWVRSEAEAALF